MSTPTIPTERPRVAAITTVWRKDSHADVIIPKLIAGYDLDGAPVRPSVDVVSLYVDQFPENDLSRRWAARFNIPMFGSVREAVTQGGSALDVDAVLIVGEHGDYPWNAKGQHLYPRRQLFEQAVDVIRGTSRVIPIFNDKHLSFSWEHSRWMYDTARELGLPLMAGSSLPVTFRTPDLDVAPGEQIDEALVLSHGPTESYGFHALETLQCMVERRRGGETGVASVELLHGDAFWEAWHAGRFPRDLYEAALATSARAGDDAEAFYRQQPARQSASPGPQPPVAFLVTYRDGLRATLLNLNGFIRDFTFAGRWAGEGVRASAFKLEGKPPRWHFSFLTHHVERFFVTHQGPYPVERTLLTSGTLAALMDAGAAGTSLKTPHLDMSYQSPPGAWRRSHGVSLPQEQVWGFTAEEV